MWFYLLRVQRTTKISMCISKLTIINVHETPGSQCPQAVLLTTQYPAVFVDDFNIHHTQ